MKFLELYISCVILAILCIVNGKILFQQKEKINSLKLIISILIFSFISMIINLYATDMVKTIVKIILTYILFCYYYVIIFQEKLSKSIIAGFLNYLSIFISETIIAIILSFLLDILNLSSMELLKNTIIANMIICSTASVIIKMNKKKLINIIENSSENIRSNSIITFLMIFTISLLGIKIPLTDWKLNIDFLITMLILLSLCIIGFWIFKQKSIINKTTSMYQQLADYSDITNELLEDYRIIAHEHKNQLLIISSMIDKENSELTEYVDNLLDKRTDNKYVWISQLNHLPLSGLKGLINYKLVEMEKLKINIGISISSEISKMKLTRLSTKQKDNLYSIIGIYLDNAIQAAKESKEKEISLELYKDKKDIVMILANTYRGKLELDKMDSYGYTTKGKNHGVGLHIVKKILEEENTFTQNRSLFENYYVQELRIHLNQIKTKKTTRR